MSKEAKHTPGPWWLNYNGHYWDVKTRRDKDPIEIEPYEYGVTIASTISDQHEKMTAGKETEEANARLIAAAPDMFEALEQIANHFDMSGYEHGAWEKLALEMADTARAAIEKATNQNNLKP